MTTLLCGLMNFVYWFENIALEFAISVLSSTKYNEQYIKYLTNFSIFYLSYNGLLYISEVTFLYLSLNVVFPLFLTS